MTLILGFKNYPIEEEESFITEEDYLRNINYAKDILNGKFDDIRKRLNKEMIDNSKKLKFEESQSIKEKIQLLENYRSKSIIVNDKKNNLDDLSSGDLDKKLSDLFESLQKEQVTNSSMSLERKSNLTYENKESNQAKRVMDLKTAFQIDSMLKDVINFGTGRKAKVLDLSLIHI